MTPTFTEARRLMTEGTELFLDAVRGLDAITLSETCRLPGWTRKHLVAHVAANADAINNLVTWASTGVETPMYRSSEERAAGIARGVTMSSEDLKAWLGKSAEELDKAMSHLSEQQWNCVVVTAQGRDVRANQTPWMRAREVFVHAVDLDQGTAFSNLPTDFNAALVEDIITKRGMTDAKLPIGPLPELTAWLAGRPHTLTNAPALGPWL